MPAMSARPTMPVRKKIIKKLYKQLRQNQAYDTPIPAPTQLGIKFYLKNHRHINQIVIENDPDARDFLAEPPTIPPNELLAVLVVTSEFLAKDPSEPPSYPTLFVWHLPDNHRTYCLFAYLTCPMESRIYSASELLELRGSHSPHIVLDKLKLNPNIIEIVKGTAGLPLSQSKSLKKAKEDVSSSTESEDRILFKGKKQGQSINGDMEWKYRGRSGSGVTSNEPMSAPTGLDAQQSEGFQRFFKAVVSPTHVRVTAGGRIVPNTRATASPTTKWGKSRVEQEAYDSIDATENGKVETETGANSNALPPAGDHVLQGHPALFQHLGMPFPLIPVHNGIPLAYGFSHLQPSAQNIAQPGSSHANPDPEKPASIAQTDGAGKDNSQPAQVKISPPEQFDHSKPFFFNGHFVYPAMGAAHMQGLPPAFIPNPYLAPGVLGSHAALAAARMGSMGQLPSALPMLCPPGYLPGPYGVAPASGGGIRAAQQPANQQPRPVVLPPISSIRPSEITRQQLNQLRTTAKYYEDQLLYNKHQIDEKSTREQVHAIKAKIAQFDHDLKMQLSFEAAYYPNQTQTQSSESTAAVPAQEIQEAAPCNAPSGPSSVKDNRSDNVSQDGSIRSGKCVPSLRQKRASDHSRSRAKGFRNRNAIGINSFRSDGNSSAALDALEAHIKLQLELDKEKKGYLPSAAALAPPFQPGAAPSAPSAPGDSQNESQPWLTAEYNHQWQSTKSYPQDQHGSWDTMQSTNTYLASDSTPAEVPFSTRTFAPSSYSAPYLVGKLPQGVNPYSARGSDYVYARELTEEEKRARHVYWGQVPTKGTGLPKFDGKDFYPPSPAKMDDKAPADPRVPTGRPELDYGLQFSSAESDPFRSSRDGASIRSQESSQKPSRAIPIINPDSLGRRDTSKTPKDFDRADASKLPRPANSTVEPTSDRNSTASSRRGIERLRSGHDLWQTVLKKGSASGTALPSAISSTTATGYLPQYFGYAAASLSPAILNATGSPARGVEAKLSEFDSSAPQGTADKLGENRPPRDGTGTESDTTKDIRQRMLRDAKRRGVIGSYWQ
ncbi:hypothetical protein DL764_002259 [Monosporascus ibericus]|uniref:Uncharacterized protein n=1 Tax=Monosporascus ibericus TaxID=155417 RepID=A0A4Q4TR07_9PEZI|nr:hypothetical protein DL764_002259 [Monosporascus ibericus]